MCVLVEFYKSFPEDATLVKDYFSLAVNPETNTLFRITNIFMATICSIGNGVFYLIKLFYYTIFKSSENWGRQDFVKKIKQSFFFAIHAPLILASSNNRELYSRFLKLENKAALALDRLSREEWKKITR